MMLLNPYAVDMGTSGLIIQAQSREEIYADKLIVFTFKPRLELIPHKLKDRNYPINHFLKTFNERKKFLETRPEMAKEFRQEMQRFLPA